MKKILVIDDSALMRSVMSDIINAEPDIVVADTAEDGSVAVRLLEDQEQYDLILLDINMPRMNGIDFLEYLNKNGYSVPTLVVSSIASKSTVETIQALELGAYDFIKKPENMKGADAAKFRRHLLEKVRCAFKLNLNVHYQEPLPEEKKTSRIFSSCEMKSGRRKISAGEGGKIIFIASSTGGPKALQSVIPRFPANIGCPIVVVQHMPAGFTGSLADRLNEMSRCKVIEAEDGVQLENGVVYVAKGGCQLSVEPMVEHKHRLAVRKDPARNGLRPCADVFLESLLDAEYTKIFCAVLTGMGSDGTNGLLQLKKMKDVYTVGQSEKTCVVYGMPRAAAQAGVVDVVADLQNVADLLTQKVM